MTSSLVRYDEACRALEKARATDEVLKIRDQSVMLRAYAKQAKNRALEVSAAEIRMRAERRIGELIQAQRETVGLAKGNAGRGRPKKLGGVSETPPKKDKATLAAAGIDKPLAKRARRLAAIPRAQFEDAIIDWREQQTYKAERVSADLARTTTKKRGGTSTQRRRATSIDKSRSPGSRLYFQIALLLSDQFDALTPDDQDEVLTMLEQKLAKLRADRLQAV